MSGRFILSFDCEGKWGVADSLERYRAALTDVRLRATYARLAQMLRDFDIAASFAFVGCFMRSYDELRQVPLADLARDIPYLKAIVGELASDPQGWAGNWAVDLVANNHEIALHGVTHTPWPSMTEAQARREMNLIPLPPVATFVYPRNLVAHQAVLRDAGIKGYRANRASSSRLAAYLSEWNILQMPENDPPRTEPIEIPAGFFVNWQSGLRRLVPPEITRARVRHLLAKASQQGSIVHFWSHPENFATAPATFDVLAVLLAEVAAARDAGQLTVMTQQQYCRSIADRAYANKT